MAEIQEKESNIMKRIVALVIVILMCLALCACDSEAVAAAKEAYAESNYEEVVAALADEEITDSEVAEMLLASKVYVAYENGKYQKVVELLLGTETAYPELNDILVISKAQIAFAESQYCEAISLLQNIEKFNENELYNKALHAAVKHAVETYDVSLLVDIYGLEVSIEESVYSIITEACTVLDYDAFCFMEEIIEKLPEGTLKDNLSLFSERNQKNKVKAFMNGEWKWLKDEESNDEVKVTLYMHEDDDKCIGFISKLSTYMEGMHYKVNDLYWQDFIFAGDSPVSVNNTTRNSIYGTITVEKASVKLDIENSKMYIHLSNALHSDRVWEKVS